MKYWILAIAMGVGTLMTAQTLREDSTWYDDQLTFSVVSEQVRKYGELEICVWSKATEMCIENLVTSYEVLIYNANDGLIWTSLWTGMYPKIRFEKNFPNAAYIIIRAKREFAINVLTGTRIYTDGFMELKYNLK